MIQFLHQKRSNTEDHLISHAPSGYPIFAGEDEGDQLALIIEVLGMPPQQLLDVSKRARHFISSKGYPRYCSVTMQADGTVILGAGKSKRGKHRGTPGTRDLVKSALRGERGWLFNCPCAANWA